ncbi:spermidine synthase [Streptomyces jumonjinensis]|uniref:Spermidine synthase-like protein n=1 Tax=Streptomyces jumonjinensis TaxID=1945 RepID=A0A646KIQ8_STRJU|nr:spermidine synthase-like protein [Streptomyces jumonjinensis]MQT00936.1 spermidine synthase-like protein [Streptomyces jumonjinensis]
MDEPVPVTRPIDYGTAKLMPDVDRARAWLLTVDGAPQSYVDLDAPAHLEFEYVRRLAHVVDVHTADADAPLDVVHLGGGALTLPRYVSATRPGSRQHAVEADRRLLALVLAELPLPDGSGIETYAMDARDWIEQAPADSADIIVADVFGGMDASEGTDGPESADGPRSSRSARVPARFTSVEYARAAARVLRPGGVHAANLADGTPFAFVRSQLATFATVFTELALIAEPAVLRGRRFGNVVLLASDAPLDIAALTRRVSADPFPARVEHGSALTRFTGAAAPVTDRDAQGSPEPPDGSFGIG